MATYVNDLRLKEIATGDESGTWGTSTNTNLELIAEAFSFGTEAITTNADTHTTTIADGSTDPGRSIFLKYTGTLDSACTITIGPNTISKLWIIENATSGSQNIIIKQGSGATITVPNGEVKAIYSDGAGTGGAMVDAFANLKVSDAAQTNITSLGTLTSLTVDDITIDGSTISDAGDLTIDVGGDIILDADGGDIRFKDAGTEIGVIENSSSDLQIKAAVQDKDIIFRGNDGGSGINALVLDMSEAGAASFNGSVTANAGVVVDNITIDGTEIDLSSGDLTIDVAGGINLDADGGEISFKDAGTEIGKFNNSSSDFVMEAGVQDKDIIFKGNDGGSGITALTLDMSEAGNASFNGTVTADAGLIADNITIDGTEIDLSSGDLTIDVAGDIILDADGGDIRFKDAGTEIGVIENSSSDLQIKAAVQDKDIIFRGNDGGSGINALVLDMSEAGAASFNGSVTANAGVVVDNITIDGTEIDLSSGDLTIDVAGGINLDADGGEISFKDAGTEIGKFNNSSSDFAMEAGVQDKDILFKGNDGGTGITALTLDMSAGGTAQFSHDIEMVDNGLLRMGAGGDLILTSDGTNGTIFTNNGDLTIDSAANIVLNADGGGIQFYDASAYIGSLGNSSGDFSIMSRTDDEDIVFKGIDGGSTITALTLDMSEAGAATFNNNVTAFSDERLKDNIETLEDGLDKVEQLRGVTYTRDDREEIGVIAQEVEKILPEIVLTADDEMGTKSVDYSRITAVLIEAVKELSARVKELENK